MGDRDGITTKRHRAYLRYANSLILISKDNSNKQSLSLKIPCKISSGEMPLHLFNILSDVILAMRVILQSERILSPCFGTVPFSVQSTFRYSAAGAVPIRRHF